MVQNAANFRVTSVLTENIQIRTQSLYVKFRNGGHISHRTEKNTLYKLIYNV
jgi:hypothetical protein